MPLLLRFGIHYKRQSGKLVPLQDLPQSNGNWVHSVIFSEVHIAKEWGITPGQYRALSEEDKSIMAAYIRDWNKMMAYDREQSDKKNQGINLQGL